MKNRIVIFALVFALMLSAAASALAVDLGKSYTKEELKESGLTRKYIALGGTWLTGSLLEPDGSEADGTIFRPAGLKVYFDEEGNLYLFRWVLSGGELKLQCVFTAKETDASSFSDTPPDLRSYRGGGAVEGPKESPLPL